MATYYQFPEGNKIIYGQDFARWRGVPSNVVFELVSDGSFIPPDADYVWLQAPGYGESGNYGNGSIDVERRDLPKPVDDICPHCGKVL